MIKKKHNQVISETLLWSLSDNYRRVISDQLRFQLLDIFKALAFQDLGPLSLYD